MQVPKYDGKRSPSALTAEMFTNAGCEVVKLERYIPNTKIRQDIWGADMLVRQGRALLALQVTDATNHSKRVTRLLTNASIKHWLECGVLFFVYSWAARGKRGSKCWKLRVTQLIMDGSRVVML